MATSCLPGLGISHGIVSRTHLKEHKGYFGKLTYMASLLVSSQTAGKTLQSSYVTPKRGFVVCCSGIEPGVPLPSGPPDSNPLKVWLTGILLSVVMPFFRQKFGSFMQIKNAIDKVEEVVHRVEKVAEVVDKVAEDIGEHLPAGKLKDAVEMIEHAAEKADKDAEALEDFIDKVEEVEDKLKDGVEALEELVHRQQDNDANKPTKEDN